MSVRHRSSCSASAASATAAAGRARRLAARTTARTVAVMIAACRPLPMTSPRVSTTSPSMAGASRRSRRRRRRRAGTRRRCRSHRAPGSRAAAGPLHLRGPAQLFGPVELALRPRGQLRQHGEVALAERPGPVVDDAQGPDARPARRGERVAGVEADLATGHGGEADEPLVARGVLDHEGLVVADRVVAERGPAGSVGQLSPRLRLVVLRRRVDEGDGRRLDAEHLLGQAGDAVEAVLGPGADEAEFLDGGHAVPFRGGVLQHGLGAHGVAFVSQSAVRSCCPGPRRRWALALPVAIGTSCLEVERRGLPEPTTDERNVLGDPLQPCGTDPSPASTGTAPAAADRRTSACTRCAPWSRPSSSSCRSSWATT